jgi:hypothetical protein
LHPGGRQEPIGGGERGRIAGLGAEEQRLRLRGDRRPGGDAVESRTLKDGDELTCGRASCACLEPQGSAVARSVEVADRLR